MHQRDPARGPLRIEDLEQLNEPRRREIRGDLDRDRILDAAEVLDVPAVRIEGAGADPREVRRKVPPARAMRHLAGLRLLEGQHQSFATGEEVGSGVVLGGLRGARQPLCDEAFVALEHRGRLRRRRAVVEPPPLRMRGIAEAAVEQSPDEVEGHRGAGVAPQQQHRIGRAVGGGEALAVDEIASIARQRDAVDRLGGRGARLRVLAGDAADEHRFAPARFREHEAHAKQDLEFRGDERRAAVGEPLGAVASLQQKTPALRRLGQLLPQPFDLEARDDRRQLREFFEAAPRRGRIGVRRLVQARVALPGGW